jgi:hypothetical protein
VAESFFATIKLEPVYRQQLPTRAAARQAFFEYIEVFDNRPRLQSSLGYRRRVEYEQPCSSGSQAQRRSGSVKSGQLPGDSLWHDELRKCRPAFALVRQWVGVQAESDRVRAEVNWLRNILGIAIADLRAAEPTREARQIGGLMNGW